MKQKKKESPKKFAAKLDELEFKPTASVADPKRLAEIICERVHKLIRRLSCHKNPNEVAFTNGLYFFYETGEKSPHDTKGRIVRIGNHPRKQDGLKERLRMHYTSNKNSSVFRKFLGGALLRKADPNGPCLKPGPGKGHWEKQDAHHCLRCRSLEKEVSQLLRHSFSFRCIEIKDKELRNLLEKKLIGSVSFCEICAPSADWLGQDVYNDKVKDSGLWNSNHVRGKDQMTFRDLEKIKQYVDETVKLYE